MAVAATGVAVSTSAGSEPSFEMPEAAVVAATVVDRQRPGDLQPEKRRSSRPTRAGDRPARDRDEQGKADKQQDPRQIARQMMPRFGFAPSEFGCLDALYVSESNWRVDADNPTSTAYGIPQALMSAHDLPPGYMTNAKTQIRWGLGYIKDAYGTPCAAWQFKQANNWY